MLVLADLARLADSTLVVNDGVEDVWNSWLNASRVTDSAAYHTVLNHELEWHDRFCSGEWSWPDLQAAIRKAQGDVQKV